MINGPKNKIYLASIEEENIEQLRLWRNDPSLRRYFRETKEISKKEQKRWYEDKVLNDPNQINFEIHSFDTKELIGHCGLCYINWINRTAEFTIYIGNSNMRGRGYGTDALSALLNYGFIDLNLNRIWCEVYSFNDAINSYRKLGFKDEGVLREHIYIEGKYYDTYMLGLLKKEWLAKKKIEKIKKAKQKVIPTILDTLPEFSEEEIKDLINEGKKASETIKKRIGNFIPKKDDRYL